MTKQEPTPIGFIEFAPPYDDYSERFWPARFRPATDKKPKIVDDRILKMYATAIESIINHCANLFPENRQIEMQEKIIALVKEKLNSAQISL